VRSFTPLNQLRERKISFGDFAEAFESGVFA
jgi:hypothetical protein